MQQQKIDFPWHLVADEWVALARDYSSEYPAPWYLYDSTPENDGHYAWGGELRACGVAFNMQQALGINLDQYSNIDWKDTLTLRPEGVHQAITHNILSEAEADALVRAVSVTSDATEKGSSVTTQKYPVVKLKNLGDVELGETVRLKKTGDLVKKVLCSISQPVALCDECYFYGNMCEKVDCCGDRSYVFILVKEGE